MIRYLDLPRLTFALADTETYSSNWMYIIGEKEIKTKQNILIVMATAHEIQTIYRFTTVITFVYYSFGPVIHEYTLF